MAFWSAKLTPGKSTPYVPPPEAVNLHLSQAAVHPNAPEGRRVSVVMKIGGSDAEDSSIIICTLNPGRLDSVPLDLFLDKYAEFQLLGADTEVHLTGYFTPPDEAIAHMSEEEEDEDFDPEDEEGPGFPIAMGVDDEDDEDEDEDEEEGEEDEDEEGEPGVTRRPHVTIKEISGDEEDEDEDEGEDEEEQEEEPAHAKGKQQPKQVTGNKRPAEDNKQQQASNKKGPQQQQQQQKQKQEADGTAAGEVKTGKKNIRTWENGFSIEELAMGPPNGKLAKGGKTVMVRYVGRLKSNGKVFDQTKGNSTFKFRLGTGEVIKGWDKGVEGMRVGDKRRLVIPPQLAYGAQGIKGAIPPNATLEFDVELVNVK